MSYKARVIALLVLFFAVTFTASATLVVISRDWASDAMDVGHGNSKFPPQTEKKLEAH